MFFSVIVPVYNVAPYLRHCLDSLVNQTSHDKEIILIDDGSTDTSGNICDEYAEQYDCVRVIHQDNQGLSGARNTGLEHATGEWISFVDSDDWVDTDMLERLQGYILATNADMYRFGCKLVNETGTKWVNKEITEVNIVTHFEDERRKLHFFFLRANVIQSACIGVYRRDIIREHGLIFVDNSKVFTEDTLFNYYYFLHIHKLVCLRDMPYYYRIRKGSLCRITSVEQKILRCVDLGEYAYQETVKQGLIYLQRNFHKIYFRLLNIGVLSFAKKITDEQLRSVLDEMWKNEFHRRCIRRIRQESPFFERYTKGRVWYDKNFGIKGKQVINLLNDKKTSKG